VPPRSHPSVSKLIMPRLLWRSARISSFGPTLCRLTTRGTAMPCSCPSVLIHIHRALWMWPAIIRTARRGAPGTVARHSSWGKCSTRKTVTRLLVLHAASSISRWSSVDFITTLQRMIKLKTERLSFSGAAITYNLTLSIKLRNTLPMVRGSRRSLCAFSDPFRSFRHLHVTLRASQRQSYLKCPQELGLKLFLAFEFFGLCF